MTQFCKGEVHFVDGDGIMRVDFIDELAFPIRGREEDVIDFKERITNAFQHASPDAIGRTVTTIKWSCPLGYHHGYIDPHARAQGSNY